VFFETNGVPRMVEVEDRQQAAAAEGGSAVKPSREKADPLALGSVGCPMSGQVIEVVAKPGGLPAASRSLCQPLWPVHGPNALDGIRSKFACSRPRP